MNSISFDVQEIQAAAQMAVMKHVKEQFVAVKGERWNPVVELTQGQKDDVERDLSFPSVKP